MHKIKNISSISLLLFAFMSSCQTIKPDEQMYLLMASSQDYSPFQSSTDRYPNRINNTLPSVLYMLQLGNLESVDTINFNYKEKTLMNECRHFEKFKFFYISEKVVKGNWLQDSSVDSFYASSYIDNYVSILDYSGDKIVLRKANADTIANGCDLLRGRSYIQNNELYYSFSQCNYQPDYYRNLINKYLQIIELTEDVYLKNSYQLAEPSIFYRMGTSAGFPFNKKGELVLNINANLDLQMWNKVDFQFPYKVDSKRYSNIRYLLKIPSCNKAVFYKSARNSHTDSLTTYYIYNTVKKSLDSIGTNYRILGMDLYKNHISYGILTLHPSFMRNKPKDIPPTTRYSNKYGFIPNLQFNTGKFFIWDLERNDFKVYVMGDLDTELLSIHEDWVYFRIFDEIRKIKLSDLDSRDYKQKTELLLKDKIRVPNIHQVFWAPEMPLRVEWVTAKPKKDKNAHH